MLNRLFSTIKKGSRKIGQGGYTLIEVAAVVAITATLAAVIIPVVADKIADAKISTAQQDVQAIKDSIICFMKDTGVPPFYSTAAAGLPLEDGAAVLVLQTIDGTPPDITSSDNGTGWLTTPGYLDDQLITNTPKYRTDGASAWKGPYVPFLKRDPWGNKYLVNVNLFGEPPDVTYDISGAGTSSPVRGVKKQEKAVYVISAGPNGKIETSIKQIVKETGAQIATAITPFAIGGDDVIARIK